MTGHCNGAHVRGGRQLDCWVCRGRRLHSGVEACFQSAWHEHPSLPVCLLTLGALSTWVLDLVMYSIAKTL